jgi:hypothetical protein
MSFKALRTHALKGQAQGAGHAGWNREKGVFQARQPEYI